MKLKLLIILFLVNINLFAEITFNNLNEAENPFELTTEMKEFANRVARQGESDSEKARKIFNALLSEDELNIIYLDDYRLRPNGYKTAKEVFHEVDQKGNRFAVCGEYALLYIALLDEVGIPASYVSVRRDYRNKKVIHACAALFLDGKVTLVDPAYKTFDIVHKKYKIIDHREAVARHYINESSIFIQNGNVKEGIAKTKTAITIYPNYVEGYKNLGDLLAWQNNPLEASINYKKAFSLDNSNFEAIYKYATTLERVDSYEEAYQNYTIIGKYEGFDRDKLFWSSKANLKLKQESRATEKLETLIKIDNTNVKAIGLLGKIYLENGNKSKAKSLYSLLGNIKLTESKEHFWMGVSLHSTAYYKEAEKEFSKALHLDKNDADLHYWIGRNFIKLDNFLDAKNSFSTALKIDSKHLKSYYQLGLLYQKREELEKANSYFKKLSSFDLKYSDGQFFSGMGFFMLKDYENANKMFKSAVRLSGDNTNAYFYWGYSLYLQKNYNEAENRLKRGIRYQ